MLTGRGVPQSCVRPQQTVHSAAAGRLTVSIDTLRIHRSEIIERPGRAGGCDWFDASLPARSACNPCADCLEKPLPRRRECITSRAIIGSVGNSVGPLRAALLRRRQRFLR